MIKHIKNGFCTALFLPRQSQTVLKRGEDEATGIAFKILISLVICSPE